MFLSIYDTFQGRIQDFHGGGGGAHYEYEAQSPGLMAMTMSIWRLMGHTWLVLEGYYSWIYFPWPLRKQAAYKQATRGPTALSPFRGTGQLG